MRKKKIQKYDIVVTVLNSNRNPVETDTSNTHSERLIYHNGYV